jgi:succinate dehydrogenase / fumarate reductase membrane anchor subunit
MQESAKSVLEPIGWLLQLISGIVLAFLVTVHFYATHMLSHEALSYAAVMERLSSAGYKAMYAALLFFVSFHAFNGLRAIILDTDFGAKNRSTVNALTMLLFIAAFIYGLYLLTII